MNVLQADSDKLLAAVSALLAEKGVMGEDDITERMAITDAAHPSVLAE